MTPPLRNALLGAAAVALAGGLLWGADRLRGVDLTRTPAVTPAAGGRATVARDQTGVARDLGIYGAGTVAFDAATSNFLFIVHDVTIPAHGKVALVHFVVQLGQGATGSDHATDGTDAECQAIADGFARGPPTATTSSRASSTS